MSFSSGTTIKRLLGLLLGALLLFPQAVHARQQQQKRQLKDLLQLQWLQATRGEPLEDTGAPGEIRFAAAAPLFFTSNAYQSLRGGPSDLYFGPWVLGEWTGRTGGGADLHAGAMFTDYRYMRAPDNNYAYAEAYAGISGEILMTTATSLTTYANIFCDYDLTSDYATDDIEPGLSAGLNWSIEPGRGHWLYARPDFTFVRAYPDSKESNTYASATLTAGWNWQFHPKWTLGTYWSGSASRYPLGYAEDDITQYIGISAEWQISDALSLVFSAVETDNWSTEPMSSYSDFTAGISLRTCLP